MPAAPMLPRYGRSTLAELLVSIGAHLGLPGCPDDLLGLPASDRYVLVMVDGLGWHQLRAHLRAVDYFGYLLGDARPITSAVPSTTATSLTTLGTGRPPGQHGMLGYRFWLPERQAVLNPLLWDVDVQPEVVQPWPTVFEAARGAGLATTSVSLARFADSGLTRAALRGPVFDGYATEKDAEDRITRIIRAATAGPRSLVYTYERELDHTGHAQGVDSAAWRARLADIDRLCERLRAELPPEVTMIITGDHGMIDVPAGHRLIMEDEPELAAEVTICAGEGRMRQLLTVPGAAERVARRWRNRLTGRAWVATRAEAIEAGWFGPMHPTMVGRVGDVLVAMRDDHAVMTRSVPRELELVGMHGSLTPAEMQVPLLVDDGS